MSSFANACPEVVYLRSEPMKFFAAARRACRRALLLPALLLPCLVASATGPAPSISKGQLARNYGRLPLRFEANQGQADPAVRFAARGAGYAVYLTDREAVLALRPSSKSSDADVVRMQLGGANPAVAPAGVDRLPGGSNYFIGNDPSRWRSDVPAYAKVHFSGVYDGIDLVYYGNQQQLEYDFVVAPRADPRPIHLHFSGAESQYLDGAGNLVIVASGGQVVFHKPVIYQLERGRRRLVAGGFTLLTGNSVAFRLGSYNRAEPLIIDPTLVYSTYLGGSYSDTMNAIAIGAGGTAFITGSTASTDYPVTTGAFQTKFSTAFVTKLNATGTAILYSTFLGGSGSSSGGDIGLAIAVNSGGDAFVTGSTYSTDFPTTKGAFQTTNKAAAGSSSTSFVTKINSTGTALLYSTYLGGTRTDTAYSLAIDSAGDAYIGGAAYSGDFPVTSGVVQSTNNSYASYGWNQFVAKLNPAGSALLYATYIGGSGDYGSTDNVCLAIDSAGDAFIASTVLSTTFPVTSGAYQAHNNSKGLGNMTLSKLNPTATKLTYATYLGGSSSGYGDDTPYGLAVDASGNAYLSGTTWESNYPTTTGAFQTTNKTGGTGAAAAFVTKMNPAGSALVYSTYLSGSGGVTGDRGRALALDASGEVFVTGSADSTDFPVTTGAYQSTNPAGFNHGAVVFMTKLNSSGTGLLYSTYFGGFNSFSDVGRGIALGSGGTIYLTGTTGAYDFPITTGAYQTAFNSTNFTTGFVSEFTFGSAPPTKPTETTLTSNANPAAGGHNVTFTAAVAPTTAAGIPSGNVVFTIDLVTAATVALNSTGFAAYTTTTPLALGTHNILASYQGSSVYGGSGGNLTESITPANPVISPAGGVHAAAFLVTITDSTPNAALYYTTDGTAPTASSTKYTAPFPVSTNTWVNAIAIVSGKPVSNVVGASYTIVSSPYSLAVPATAISTSGATLNALVNSFGMAGSYYFVYGTSSSVLTSVTPTAALPPGGLGGHIGIAPVRVSTALTGLITKTAYYYKVVTITPAGTSSGEVLKFTTN
jgi:hypothetical protein